MWLWLGTITILGGVIAEMIWQRRAVRVRGLERGGTERTRLPLGGPKRLSS
jgi:hypothetical protein